MEVALLSPQEKDLDVLRVLLLLRYQSSPLPELYEVFGREHLIDFLEIFSGVTFQVPSLEGLKRTARDADIFLTMAKRKHGDKVQLNLATRYDLSKRSIRKIYRDTYERLEKHGHLGILGFSPVPPGEAKHP